MSGQLTRGFSVGPADFAVRCPTPAILDAVESLFIDLAQSSDRAPVTLFDLEIHDGDRLELRHGTESIGNPTSEQGALARLVTTVSRLALDHDPSQLHLHCAALARGEFGTLIAAPSGTGKTTLAAALAESGWDYLSDEMAALSEGRRTATGFAKPLMLKPRGSGPLPNLRSKGVLLGDEPDRWWLIPASSIPAKVRREVVPNLVVLLQHASEGGFDRAPEVELVHPADMTVSLMEQTMDAERHGERSLHVLAELAAAASCVRFSVGRLKESVELLDDLVSSPPSIVDVLELPSPDRKTVTGFTVVDSVRSVLIGGRAVIHDTNGGVIVALDEAGSAIWGALHGHFVDWWQPEAMDAPGSVGFLDQLAQHGLVTFSDSLGQGSNS